MKSIQIFLLAAAALLALLSLLGVQAREKLLAAGVLLLCGAMALGMV